MAEPVTAAVVAILKSFSKKLTKDLVALQVAKQGGKVIGLTAKELAKMSQAEVLNLIRAKAVKSATPHVAKAMGMTTKELTKALSKIKLTPNMKKIAKGAQYVRTMNSLLKNPEGTVVNLTKNKIMVAGKKAIGDQTKPIIKKAEEEYKKRQTELQLIVLNQIQGSLQAVSEDLVLSDYVFEGAGSYDIDHLHYVQYLIEMDMSMTTSSYSGFYNEDYVIVSQESGGKGGGYKAGVKFKDYLIHVESLITTGTASIQIDDFY